MMYLFLIAGFLLLIKGADLFVDGSSSLAKYLKVPSVIIGLTIVAMGTSAPEAAVSITASLTGNNEISLGNIIGSNLFNLLVVIGVCSVISPIRSNPEILKRDMTWNIGVSALLLVLSADGMLSRLDGAVLITGMAVYLAVILRQALRERAEEQTGPRPSMLRADLMIGAGLAGVILGGQMVVNNASLIAAEWGMSDTLIGLTIVAAGTSLPELVTSVSASRKGDSGIAVGNAVGSCLFNILFILGAASLISPISVSAELVTDAGILTAVSCAMYLFARTKMTTSRLEGFLCEAVYLAYSAYIILR